MTLEQELESDSWRDYAKAGRLIDLLRAANMRERCRTARERYNESVRDGRGALVGVDSRRIGE